jgi:hypothetical protein
MFETTVDVTFSYTQPAFRFQTDRAICAAFNYRPRIDFLNLKKKVAMGVVKQLIEANGPMPTGVYNLKMKFNMFTNEGTSEFVRIS